MTPQDEHHQQILQVRFRRVKPIAKAGWLQLLVWQVGGEKRCLISSGSFRQKCQGVCKPLLQSVGRFHIIIRIRIIIYQPRRLHHHQPRRHHHHHHHRHHRHHHDHVCVCHPSQHQHHHHSLFLSNFQVALVPVNSSSSPICTSRSAVDFAVCLRWSRRSFQFWQ